MITRSEACWPGDWLLDSMARRAGERGVANAERVFGWPVYGTVLFTRRKASAVSAMWIQP